MPLKNIDLSKVSASDFKGIGDSKYFNLQSVEYYGNEGMVLGNIHLKLIDTNTVIQLTPDTYDFDIRGVDFQNLPLNSGKFFDNYFRNFATVGGNINAGFGTPYKINLIGTSKIGY